MAKILNLFSNVIFFFSISMPDFLSHSPKNISGSKPNPICLLANSKIPYYLNNWKYSGRSIRTPLPNIFFSPPGETNPLLKTTTKPANPTLSLTIIYVSFLPFREFQCKITKLVSRLPKGSCWLHFNFYLFSSFCISFSFDYWTPSTPMPKHSLY